MGSAVEVEPCQKIGGGKVVIVDDSIVRGTTSKKLIDMLFKAGAKEVHLRISSSPVISPCYYGIDISTHEELIAYKRMIEEIRREVRLLHWDI